MSFIQTFYIRFLFVCLCYEQKHIYINSLILIEHNFINIYFGINRMNQSAETNLHITHQPLYKRFIVS